MIYNTRDLYARLRPSLGVEEMVYTRWRPLILLTSVAVVSALLQIFSHTSRRTPMYELAACGILPTLAIN